MSLWSRAKDAVNSAIHAVADFVTGAERVEEEAELEPEEPLEPIGEEEEYEDEGGYDGPGIGDIWEPEYTILDPYGELHSYTEAQWKEIIINTSDYSKVVRFGLNGWELIHAVIGEGMYWTQQDWDDWHNAYVA